MERELLRVLDFDLTQPTIKTFLRRYIKAASGARVRVYRGAAGRWAGAGTAHHLVSYQRPARACCPGSTPLPQRSAAARLPASHPHLSLVPPRPALAPPQARSRWT